VQYGIADTVDIEDYLIVVILQMFLSNSSGLTE
jgi:hypothetical protein